MKKFLTLSAFVAAPLLSAVAQVTDSTAISSTTTTVQQTAPANGLTVSGYIEAYYSHDFTASKIAQERPSFLYNYKHNREINVNLAFLRGAYSSDRVRANLAIQVGTYPQYNYASEQELVKTIYEANAGVKLSKTHDLWIDAGIFASHIGFESAIGKDTWTLTRSMVAENSPYYLAGVKATYNSRNGKWTLLGSVVNGWQRIKKLDGYSGPSVSTQIQYRPSSAITLNWSTFLGSDRPDSLKQSRMYHNLYAIFQPGKIGVTLGFDVGSDRKPQLNGSGSYVWYTPVVILRYSPRENVRLAGRLEYYNDQNGVIIATRTANGFQTWGYSLNTDFVIFPNALFRIEGRTFHSKDAIFETRTGPSHQNTAITTSLAVSF